LREEAAAMANVAKLLGWDSGIVFYDNRLESIAMEEALKEYWEPFRVTGTALNLPSSVYRDIVTREFKQFGKRFLTLLTDP
jgi:hypothetical protein